MGRNGCGEMAYAGLRFVRTRVVVAERERQQDRQPKDRTDDDKLGALGTIAGVHEVKNNQGGLDRGNDQSDDDVELMKVLEGGPDGDPGAKHQGRENGNVDFWRNNVLGHARLSLCSYRCLSIRYNNGNR